MRKFVKLFGQGTICSSIAACYRFSTYIVTLVGGVTTQYVGWFGTHTFMSLDLPPPMSVVLLPLPAL